MGDKPSRYGASTKLGAPAVCTKAPIPLSAICASVASTDGAARTAWAWLTLLPPLLMALLLLTVSGIPMLEASMAKRRPGYADYMRTTSALIPWPPRH